MTYRVWEIRESRCIQHDALPTRLAATERRDYYADRYPWGEWYIAGKPLLLLPAPRPFRLLEFVSSLSMPLYDNPPKYAVQTTLGL